jgi:hypothetical protein
MSPVLGVLLWCSDGCGHLPRYLNFTISSIICELVLNLAKMSFFFSKSKIPSQTTGMTHNDFTKSISKNFL